MAELSHPGRLARYAFWLYDASFSLVIGAALAPLELVRIAIGRTPPATLRERLGRASLPPPVRGRRIVVHAVSVGEIAAARTLISSLSAAAADLSFVLTTGNRLGRRAAELSRESIAAVEGVAYLPWDRAAALRTWLEVLQPAAVVIVETEIWPNLFRACGELGIPLFVVSGRLYPRDVPRYRLARSLLRHILDIPDWIGVQNDEEKEAFISIGAPPEHIETLGNLKLGAVPVKADVTEPWRASIAAGHLLLVAGSTHHPEEDLLLRCLVKLRVDFPTLRLVLAPRHTSRAARLRRQSAAHGLRVAVWSQPSSATTDWDVLLLDEVGRLAALYHHADVAFIGGSLVHRGGHNPLEAAAQARVVVIGPSFESFRDAVRGLLQAGAICVLPADDRPEDALCAALADLLGDERKRTHMGQRGAAFCQSQLGVSQRYAQAILSRLSRP